MPKGSKGRDLVQQMKLTEPEYFHSMVKMHLSFLLDLHTDECDCSFLYDKHDKESKMKKAFAPVKKKGKGVMDGVPLTQEGVCQVYQIIEYLGRSHNIVSEGLFRKHGNLKKQNVLKERLNKGVALNLDEDEFSVHECAAVLKNFLANLPEPLLTDAYYRAHCQVPLLCKSDKKEEGDKSGVERQIECLQLLFQLIPEVNYNLLGDLLLFLHAVSQHESDNKMSAGNLGTIFSTHIMCPRKLSPESLQSNHQLLSRAVSFMIEHADKLFNLPAKLVLDIENHMAQKLMIKASTPKPTPKKASVSATPSVRLDSPVVNTVFSFVDREASKSVANTTDQALAALYAHVQGMPESAQKRRLVAKLNEANGKGTPDVATSGSVRTMGRRQRRKSGDGLINLLTPRRKRSAAHGGYSFQHPQQVLPGADSITPVPQHSFRRQTSLQTTALAPATLVSTGEKRCPKSPSQSCPEISTPRRRTLRSSTSSDRTTISSGSGTSPVDEVDTPGRSGDERESTQDSDGSFLVPPLPPRTPAPTVTPYRNAVKTNEVSDLGEDSPLSRVAASIPDKMREEAMTPRSRAPVIVCSSSQLEKWNHLIPESPMHSESETANNRLRISFDKDVSLLSEEPKEKTKSSCRTRSLSNEFKAYLAQQGMEVLSTSSDASSLEETVDSETSFSGEMSYSENVRRILREGEVLSTSMQAIMDGEDPSEEMSLEQNPDNDDGSEGYTPPESRQSGCSSTSTLRGADTSTDQENGGQYDENADPNAGAAGQRSRRGRKRRSLTELGNGKTALPRPPQGNIFFETDL